MAITEQTVIDKIEVLEDGVIQVRRARRIYDDVTAPPELIAERYHRSVLHPGDDVSNLPTRLQRICNAVWTPAVIAAYQEAHPNG